MYEVVSVSETVRLLVAKREMYGDVYSVKNFQNSLRRVARQAASIVDLLD